jgi:predicted nucleotidyltransferase
MTRDEIIARLKAHETEIKAEGVVYLALFGSRARGNAPRRLG